ncbi:hyaluronan-mediated motility receptor-like [Sycon ciliatum]|uniref:hyaluronan-mediated motility receptor-like n=1 Tax=Sycon ciliatum TaxID=27933 RepID=UPI0031F65F81
MFSKAKRFDESKACGPPPGHYNPKREDVILHGPASFAKASRFVDEREAAALAGQTDSKENVPEKQMPVAQTPVMKRSSFRTPSLQRTQSMNRTPLKNSNSLGDLVIVNPEKEEVRRLLAEQKKLYEQLKSKDEQLASVKAELQRLTQDESKDQVEQDSMAAEMELLRNTISILSQQKEELVLQAEAAAVHTESVESDNNHLHDMLSSLRQDIDQLTTENNRLSSDHQVWQSELSDARTHREVAVAMTERVQQLESEEHRLTHQCAQLSHELEQVTHRLSAEIQQSTTMAGSNVSLELRVQSLEDVLLQERSRVHATETSLQAQTEASKRLQQTIDSLDLQLEMTAEQHQKEISTYSGRLLDADANSLQYQLDLKASAEEAATFRDQLTAELAKLQLLEENMEKERSARSESEVSFESRLGEQRQQICGMGEQIAQKTNELEALQSDLLDERTRLTEAQSSLVTVEDQRDALRAQCSDHTAEIDRLASDKAVLRQKLEQACDTNQQHLSGLEEQLTIAKEEICSLQTTIENHQTVEDEMDRKWQEQLVQSEEKAQRVNQELSRRLIDAEKRLVHTVSEHQEARLQLQERLQAVEAQLDTALAEQEQNGEAEKWREAYETLRDQCAPFTAQLEMFSAEKQLLESQTSLAKSEVEDLNRRYGELLGHQNQKQKIKHIMKIKEENLTMKQELMRLREQCDRQKRTIRQHEERPRVASVMAASRKALGATNSTSLPSHGGKSRHSSAEEAWKEN